MAIVATSKITHMACRLLLTVDLTFLSCFPLHVTGRASSQCNDFFKRGEAEAAGVF